MGSLNRTEEITLDISSDDENTPAFYVGDAKRGSYVTPGTLNGGPTIGIEVSYDKTTWLPLRVAAGTAVAAITPAADPSALPFPESVFSHRYARFVFSVAQTSDRELKVFLAGD